MASIWFTLSIILCIISEIITVPLRKAPQEKEYFGLNEQGERIQTGRIRRAAIPMPAGCGEGIAYVLTNVPHCHVTNAQYNAEMKLCLEQIVHVPGMPDGNKGYIYIAHNHYLYKTYQATVRLDFLKCPIAATTRTESSTSSNAPSATDLVKPPSSKNVEPTTASSAANVSTTAQTSPVISIQITQPGEQGSPQNTTGNVPSTLAEISPKPTTTVNVTTST